MYLCGLVGLGLIQWVSGLCSTKSISYFFSSPVNTCLFLFKLTRNSEILYLSFLLLIKSTTRLESNSKLLIPIEDCAPVSKQVGAHKLHLRQLHMMGNPLSFEDNFIVS